MTEKFPNQTEKREHPDHALIKRKYLISRSVTGENLGAQNIDQAAEILYAALYEPERIDELVSPSEKFPERIKDMKAPLNISPQIIPPREDFVKEFRRILTRKVPYGEAINNEIRERQFANIMKRCEQTVIWTEGDVGEQLYKIASSKFFNKARREISEEKGIGHRDVLTVFATEKKLKRLPEVIEKFKEKGVKIVLIVEDRIENIQKATKIIKEAGFEVFPILIKNDESFEENMPGVSLANNFFDLEKLLDEKQDVFQDKKTGALIDLDGVLLDNEKRRELQIETLIEDFRKRGWI